MAITALTTLNLLGITQTIVFSNTSTVDEIDFGNNHITMKAIASFSLSQVDFLAYFQYIDIFQIALLKNFNNLSLNFNIAIPQSEYDFKIGSTRTTYDQHSGTNDVLNLTYIFVNKTVTFASTPSDIIISLQEFFLMISHLRTYAQQIGLT